MSFAQLFHRWRFLPVWAKLSSRPWSCTTSTGGTLKAGSCSWLRRSPLLLNRYLSLHPSSISTGILDKAKYFRTAQDFPLLTGFIPNFLAFTIPFLDRYITGVNMSHKTLCVQHSCPMCLLSTAHIVERFRSRSRRASRSWACHRSTCPRWPETWPSTSGRKPGSKRGSSFSRLK